MAVTEQTLPLRRRKTSHSFVRSFPVSAPSLFNIFQDPNPPPHPLPPPPPPRYISISQSVSLRHAEVLTPLNHPPPTPRSAVPSRPVKTHTISGSSQAPTTMATAGSVARRGTSAEPARGGETEGSYTLYVCVCARECERERDKERGREREGRLSENEDK